MQHTAAVAATTAQPVESPPAPVACPVACKVSNASKYFQMGKTRITALDGLSISIDAGAFVAIAGPSGSGKSTLLNLLGCIELPDRGSVEVLGHDTSGMSDGALTRVRRDAIGFIFQNFSLIPVLSAAENVEYPLVLAGMARDKRRELVAGMLEQVGLADRARHLPGELSGGQRQRVAIARALVKSPRLVIADEPTANLDSRTGQELMKTMRRIQEQSRTTFVVATHDPAVQAHASRRFTIVDGRVTGEES
ncbi:MAG: ABC transporter ATP-binding protein [Tropicimonas sp.]|uniref:ABC transporter ATP-binding protein n=1 Tax=Tropicimonas sp. TaxID=2067044 RepID=UPI003A86FC3C